MLILGLTGPTGAGKGFVSAQLAKLGFAVVDADRAAHDVMAPGTPLTKAVARAFGLSLSKDGALDRQALGTLVFSDAQKLRKLDALTHPVILRRIQAELDGFARKGCRAAVVDAPALFESGADRLCACAAAVTAPKSVRLARIMQRDGLTRKKALKRILAQPDDSFYLSKARFVLRNDDETDRLEQDIRAMADSLLAEAGGAEAEPCAKK